MSSNDDVKAFYIKIDLTYLLREHVVKYHILHVVVLESGSPSARFGQMLK